MTITYDPDNPLGYEPRPDAGNEPASGEPFMAKRVIVRMSSGSPFSNPEAEAYHREAAIDILDEDAEELGKYMAALFEVPAFTITHGVGYWRGVREMARVIEVVTPNFVVKDDLAGIRAQALKLGYTVFVTVDDVEAAELY